MLTNLRRGMTRAYSVVNPKERRKREEAISDIAKEVFKEMVAIDSDPESNVASTIRIVEWYSTQTIACIRDSLTGTGKIQSFINYHTYVGHEEDLRIAAHYKDSGLIETFSITAITKPIRLALGASFLKCHPAGTPEYQKVLDVLTVALGAYKNQPHITNEKISALHASGMLRWEAEGVVRTQMLNDGSNQLMTKTLASIVMRHPSRAHDISEYLKSKLLTPIHVDAELLDLYLSTESKAMAEGVL